MSTEKLRTDILSLREVSLFDQVVELVKSISIGELFYENPSGGQFITKVIGCT